MLFLYLLFQIVYNTCAHVIFSATASIDKRAKLLPGFCAIGRKQSIHIGYAHLSGALITDGAGTIHVGNKTTINERTLIRATSSIHIDDYVLISSDVVMMDSDHHAIDMTQRIQEIDSVFHGCPPLKEKVRYAPIVIHRGAWVGRRAMILKGVCIGEGAIVAAGAMVTHDVPPHTIVAGNPAKVVRHVL